MILARQHHVRLKSICYISFYRYRFLEGPCRAVPVATTQAAMLGGTRWKHQITYRAYVPPCYKDHDHKNMTIRRPMSPHLTIYAPTITAMTSIAQRITGTAVTFFALLLSGGTLFLPNGVETYVSILQSMDMSRVTVFLVKFMVGAPFAYHYFNGIRFVMWNAGKLLSIPQVYDSAYKTFIATAVCILLFAIL